jgi:ribosomal-protein-alanine N-acetyltransferase
MRLKLIPIIPDQSIMQPHLQNDFCKENYKAFEDYYPTIGFTIPWIGYFVLYQQHVVGVGAFKGAPKNNTVEIAYGVNPQKEGKGIGTAICGELIRIALHENPQLKVTARTLKQESPSTSILKKNGFRYTGIVNDPDDGDVWQWELV